MSQVAANIANLGVEGVTEGLLGTFFESALEDAIARNIDDPVARREFITKQMYDKVVASKVKERNAKVARAQRIEKVSVALAVQARKTGRPDKALKGILVGSLKGRDSVGLAQLNATQEAFGELHIALSRAGVLDAFIHANEDLTRQIYSRSKSNISKDALAIRAVLEDMQTRRLIRMKMAGLEVDPLPNRIARQHHDPYLMKNARKYVEHPFGGEYATDAEAWVAFVLPRLEERTFRGWQDSPGVVLKKIYHDFMVGRNNVIDDAVGNELHVEAALTAERKLHFTPDGEVDYMMKFGAGSLGETIFSEIGKYGKHLGLVQILGPEPHKTLRMLVHDMRNSFPNDARLESYVRGFDAGQLNTPIGRDWSEVSGRNDMVVGTKAHEVSSWLQVFQLVTKMGQSVLAAGMDIPGMAAEFNFQSGNAIGSLARAFGAAIDGITNPADQRRVADALAIGLEGTLNEHYMRLGGSISPSGRRTQIMNATFKWNLLGPWTNSVRRGFYMSMSRFMASGIQESAFTPRMMALLDTYGIGKEDLKILRTKLDFGTDGGPQMFDPTKIGELDHEIFGLGIEGMQAREELKRKMTGFMLDRMNFGVFTPDADTRSIVHRGLPKGDPMRVLLDLIFQLKQYPIGFVRGPMANSLMGPGQTMKSGATTLGIHIAFLLPFGAAINHLKDFAKGREQFYPTNKDESVRYFTNAMLQSGAMGLYGDFILGQVDSIPEGLLRLAGPTANDALDIYEVMESAVKQDGETGAKLFQSIRNYIPMADLFYVKTPFDYAIMYGLAEQLDPGFARSYEKRVEAQRMGRGLIFSPEQYAIGV